MRAKHDTSTMITPSNSGSVVLATPNPPKEKPLVTELEYLQIKQTLFRPVERPATEFRRGSLL